jgi:hypothetical protein
MKYKKIYNYVMKEIFKLKKSEDRTNNLFILICLLIWRFSLEGKYLDTTLQMINEFDFNKNFKGEENEVS